MIEYIISNEMKKKIKEIKETLICNYCDAKINNVPHLDYSGYVCDECYNKYPQRAFPGRKDDKEKLRIDLIPIDVLKDLAEVYTIGAKKYSDKNWEKGLNYSRVYGALLRHLFEFMLGNEMDEDGQKHISSVIWNAVALNYFSNHKEKYKEFDDR